MPVTHHRQVQQGGRGKSKGSAPVIAVHHGLHLAAMAHRAYESTQYLLNDRMTVA